MIRLLLFVLVGLSTVAVGVVAWVGLGTPAAPPAFIEPPPPPPARVAVLAAAQAVPAGSLLRPEDVNVRELLPAEVPEGALVDQPDLREGLRGAMVRRSLSAGDPIRAEAVLRPGDHGFLAAVLAPGTRAVTVGVDAVTGSAGLIWPGDRVDLILTQALDEQGTAPGRRVVGEAVLTDLRVIAVDRTLVQGAQASGGVADALRGDGARTVTLEVSAEAATRVTVASRLGRLSLTVRAAGRSDTVLETAAAAALPTMVVPSSALPATVPTVAGRPTPPAGLVWGGDVSGALAPRGGDGGRQVLRVYQGTAKMEEIQFR